jgi:hypothetical protein
MELTTSLILLASSFYGSTNPILDNELKMSREENAPVKEQKLEIGNNNPNYQFILIENYVKEYFKDDPALIEVAKCESTFRHFDKDGNVIRGIANKKDVGVMQINEIYHKDASEKLGLDIHTLEGNMAYAKWLYEKEGLQPWISSSKCWAKTVSTIDSGNKIIARN